MTVIDLLTTPELAKQYRVIAIPTLLTLSAGTERRWVGDVSEQSLREHFEGSHGH